MTRVSSAESSTYLPVDKQEFGLDNLLALPHILMTRDDAIDLMNLVWSRRDQNTHRKIAPESGVAWCTQQIHILQKGVVKDSVLRRALLTLRVLQCKLSSATEDLSRSHCDIGTVRAMIRRQGLPVPS